MLQFGVAKEIEFDAAHRVPEHAGQCANLHGHRYKVTLGIEGYLQQEGSAGGMVLDFADIKKCLQEIHDIFDHGCIVYVEDEVLGPLYRRGGALHHMKHAFLEVPPTAENLAMWCRDFAKNWFIQHNLPGRVVRCEVHETPTSVAWYPA